MLLQACASRIACSPHTSALMWHRFGVTRAWSPKGRWHMSVRERILALVEPLKEEEQGLLAERDRLAEELGKINDDLREIQKLLRTADPDSYVKETGNGGGPSVSEDVVLRVFRLMWAHPEKHWSVAEISNRMTLHQSSVSNAMQVLRARGDIRPTGRLPRKPGQKGTTSMGFKIAEGATPPEDEP